MEPATDTTTRRSPAPDRTERRLVLVVGAIVFVDTMFYAAIAPLLPSLAHELHLSKFAAGVMTASYPVGTLVASIPAGVLAARAGPKFTVTLGLSLLAVSTLAFGFLHSELALDIARLVEGIGGACSWSGGLAWIVAEAPADRRGALIGSALGAAIAGALFGPLIGTAASVVGRGAAFSGVVVVATGLIVVARRIPSAHVDSAQGVRDLFAALRGHTVARSDVARDPPGHRLRHDQRARAAADAPPRGGGGGDRRRVPGGRCDRGDHQPGHRTLVGSARPHDPGALRPRRRGRAADLLHAPPRGGTSGRPDRRHGRRARRLLGAGDGDARGRRRSAGTRSGTGLGARQPRVGRGTDPRLGCRRRRRQGDRRRSPDDGHRDPVRRDVPDARDRVAPALSASPPEPGCDSHDGRETPTSGATPNDKEARHRRPRLLRTFGPDG